MDDAEIERLFLAHARGLFAFLAYRTGDRVLAEDLLADSFERVLRARPTFNRRRGTEKSWLYAIALNVARDHARRETLHSRSLEAVATQAASSAFSSPFDAVHNRDLVARAVATLSVEEREAIALRYGADLTVPEIARVTRQPLARAEGRVYRALRKLNERLSTDGSA